MAKQSETEAAPTIIASQRVRLTAVIAIQALPH